MEIPEQIGRFRVLELVGEGAMGVVFRARDESLDRDVALKLMRVQSADPEDKERFLREARAVARLQHPNIVTVYELGDHHGSPFIAMELLEGVDLQRAIEGGLRPNPRATLPIVLQLLAGLGHAHENGIVHRDVKPSNLFLPRGRPAKIMDFGVARLGGHTTTSGAMVGTPNYMSPEQVQSQATDGRSDLFSAGLILYELVTGEKAYQGDSVVSLMYKIAHEDPDLGLIPPGPQWQRLRAVLARALAKNPDARYPTAAEMSAELAGALQDLGGSIDGAAASDKGLMKRTLRSTSSRTAHASPTSAADVEIRPYTQSPEAAPVPPPEPPRPSPIVRRRPGWVVPAFIGVAALALTAVTLVVLLMRSPGPSPTVSPEPASPPSAGGGSLVSGGSGGEAVPSAPSPTTPIASPSSAAIAPPAARPSPVARPAASPRVALGPPANVDRAGPGARETGAASARLDRANALYENGRYAAALAEARAVLRREPGNAEAKTLVEDIEVDVAVESRLKQAKDALRRGDREEALAQVRAGLAVKSTDGRLMSLFKELTQ